MSRRLVATVVALVTALTLSACGDTVTASDVVAEVGGAELTGDDLATLVSDPLIISTFSTPPPTDGAIELNAADNIATVWIWLEAGTQQGVVALDDEAAAAEQFATMGGDSAKAEFEATTGVVRQFLTRVQVANTHLADGTLELDQLREASRKADVRVDSRYGYWNVERASIIPFGTQLEPLATTTTAATS